MPQTALQIPCKADQYLIAGKVTCSYYAGGYEVYSAPYYYPGYSPYPYYYGPRYYHGPRFYGGYRYYYWGGHSPRYYRGGYRGGHH
nr:hypothetical protein [Pseudomonas sp. PMCC200367]